VKTVGTAYIHHGDAVRTEVEVTANNDGTYPSMTVRQVPLHGGETRAVFLDARQVDFLLEHLPRLQRHLRE